MIPILFDPEEVDFSTSGIGPLANAISCTVAEQMAVNGAGGAYTLELSYPCNGPLADFLQLEYIICAIPSLRRVAQPFRIYRRSLGTDGTITVYANHISYDLTYTPVAPFSGNTLQGVLSAMVDAIPTGLGMDPNRFSYDQDNNKSGTYELDAVSNVRNVIGGSGGVADAFEMDVLWDKWTVQLLSHRGRAAPTPVFWQSSWITYGIDVDTSASIDGVYPYYKNGDDFVASGLILVTSPGQIRRPAKFQGLDLTRLFDSVPTAEDLRTAATNWLSSNDIDAIRQTITPTISQGGVFGGSTVQPVDIGDEVQLSGVPGAGWGDGRSRITSISLDVLREQYISIGIGDEQPNVAYTVAELDTVANNKFTANSAGTSSGGGGGNANFDNINASGNISAAGSISTYGYTIPRIQHGSISVPVTANSSTDFTILFPKEFPGVPDVVITPRHNSTGANYELTVRLRTVSASNATGVIYCDSGNATWALHWVAMYG